MKTAYLTHSDYDLHLTPAGHPEQVDRLSVINERLSKPEFNDLHKLTSPMGTNEQVNLCKSLNSGLDNLSLITLNLSTCSG